MKTLLLNMMLLSSVRTLMFSFIWTNFNNMNFVILLYVFKNKKNCFITQCSLNKNKKFITFI